MATARTLLPEKDPSDIKDYGIDWSDVLAAEGESAIATSVWKTPVPDDIVVEVDTFTATHAIVWVSGGTPGSTYALTNTITTASGTPRTHEKTIYFKCKEQ